tara:strand:+ start:801 stop:944 length:144 start_codon:yes stop_codon:yes gene_type:complete
MTEIFPNPFTNWTTTSISTPSWTIPAIDTYYFDVYDVDFDDSEESEE